MTRFWEGKLFCVITGASRGIGREIALQFSSHANPGSIFLLIARNQEGLESTKNTMSHLSSGVYVHCESFDLASGNEGAFKDMFDRCLAKSNVVPSSFDHSIIIHNAASLGNVKKKVAEFSDVTELQHYFSLNLSSFLCLNSVFLNHFPETIKKRTVVNITSLAGVEAFPSWGFYCTGKAARDMAFKVLAAENPSLNVLSYSPGPVETDMLAQVAIESADIHVRETMSSILSSKQALSCQETTRKLIKVLEQNRYKSGQHVDYYDDV